MAATADPEDVPGGREFTKTTSPVPMLTDNERRVFYVGMSRARERLVLMENLVDGAPTLPIDVLLNNEPTGADIEELIDQAKEPVEAGLGGDAGERFDDPARRRLRARPRGAGGA